MPMRARAVLLLLVIGLAPSLRAQQPGSSRAAGDSVAAIEEARRAQRQFEVLRRGALRIEEGRGPSPCEVRLGRYCYWYDSVARPPAPREAEHVTAARWRFLHVLDSLGERSPADSWIAGQRVRYRIDALDTAGAVAVATRGCGVPGWWCYALRGHALHVAGQYDAAGKAFDVALVGMPADDRCAWENPSVLLEQPYRDRVKRLSCEGRRHVAARLLWLGDPQHSRPGNDLHTEFLARRVASVLEADARFIYGTRWSWDTNELLLRYGWPTWWTRERRYPVSGPSEIQLVGHEPVPAFNFLPRARATLEGPGHLRNDDWQPADESPAMRYAPRYLAWWRDATAQVAQFRRGESLLVVAAYAAPADSMLADARATLAISTAPFATVYVSPPVHGRRGIARTQMPRPGAGSEVVASVEVVDDGRRAMARHRLTVPALPNGRLALSDLVLHEPLDEPPATITLTDVLERMLPDMRLGGDRVGVFWETYGVAASGELLDVALTIARVDAPWLRRTAARLRLADPVTPVQIRWRASPRVHGEAPGQAVAVNLTNLARGTYRLRLRVEADDGVRAESERMVRIDD